MNSKEASSTPDKEENDRSEELISTQKDILVKNDQVENSGGKI